MPPKVRDVVRRLERDGSRLARTGGDRRQNTHPTKPGTVTIAGGMSEDVPTGTWLDI